MVVHDGMEPQQRTLLTNMRTALRLLHSTLSASRFYKL